MTGASGDCYNVAAGLAQLGSGLGKNKGHVFIRIGWNQLCTGLGRFAIKLKKNMGFIKNCEMQFV